MVYGSTEYCNGRSVGLCIGRSTPLDWTRRSTSLAACIPTPRYLLTPPRSANDRHLYLLIAGPIQYCLEGGGRGNGREVEHEWMVRITLRQNGLPVNL